MLSEDCRALNWASWGEEADVGAARNGRALPDSRSWNDILAEEGGTEEVASGEVVSSGQAAVGRGCGADSVVNSILGP